MLQTFESQPSSPITPYIIITYGLRIWLEVWATSIFGLGPVLLASPALLGSILQEPFRFERARLRRTASARDRVSERRRLKIINVKKSKIIKYDDGKTTTAVKPNRIKTSPFCRRSPSFRTSPNRVKRPTETLEKSQCDFFFLL